MRTLPLRRCGISHPGSPAANSAPSASRAYTSTASGATIRRCSASRLLLTRWPWPRRNGRMPCSPQGPGSAHCTASPMARRTYSTPPASPPAGAPSLSPTACRKRMRRSSAASPQPGPCCSARPASALSPMARSGMAGEPVIRGTPRKARADRAPVPLPPPPPVWSGSRSARRRWVPSSRPALAAAPSACAPLSAASPAPEPWRCAGRSTRSARSAARWTMRPWCWRRSTDSTHRTHAA